MDAKEREASLCSAKKPKRQVSISTFKKWQVGSTKHFRGSVDRSGLLVDMLWCDVCRKNESSLHRMKNFSMDWINGSTNQRTSNVTDHATSEQHLTAMTCTKIQTAKASHQCQASYSPLPRCFLKMDAATKSRMKKKFDISYMMAKENIAFRIYPAIFELEQCHGVDLGSAYKTKGSAKQFTHYIAESLCHNFAKELLTLHFDSFLMDGSTDAGNIENELVVVMY